MKHNCHLCGEKCVSVILDFNQQPVCNRFLLNKGDQERKFPLKMGQCFSCGLIQLINPLPAAHIHPRVGWIHYSEPEDHLVDVAEKIIQLDGINSNASICGVTQYDIPLIEQLNQRGYHNSWILNPKKDLNIQSETFGCETIVEKLSEGDISRHLNSKEQPDIIIASFVLEHTPDIHAFLSTVRQFVKPTGYVIFQVPDFQTSLELLEYSSIWEEHVSYFTLPTFENCSHLGGFKPVWTASYQEQAVLCTIWRPAKKAEKTLIKQSDLDAQRLLGDKYKKGFEKIKSKVQTQLTAFKKNTGKIAILGAGHQACQFVNLFDIGENIEFVVDDFEKKQGLFMPGSHLEIKSSDHLLIDNIKLCLLAVSKNLHSKIVLKNQQFIQKKGRFESVYKDWTVA
ncbi:MAG: methyltransferase domain-containing protein [Pseudomonadota bacterium]